ncbi:MAG: MarR family transcriptional regulator [Actinobacteria bacterium]|nr:MarR family transcriptional regulator [Actinomycetota bacterium]
MSGWGDLDADRQQAWYGFLRTHADVVRALDRELQAACGISFGDYDVLVTLANGPAEGLRMGQLAEAIVLSPSGVTRVVTRLERAGLVERRAENQRIVRAVLTAQGRARLEAAAPVHLGGIQRRFLAPLGDGAPDLAAAWRRIGDAAD